VTYNINGGSNQTVTLNASGTATITGTYTTNTTINIVSVASAGTPSCVNPQTSSTTLTILPLPTASVSVSPTTICANSSATFTFTGTPNATVTYNINGGSNQTVTLNASGTATITGTYTTNTTINIVSVASAGTPSCVNPQTSSTTLTIVQPSIPGNDASIVLCVLSPSVDLFTLLGSTAQAGGTWSPALTSGTGVFNPAVDPAGTYTYTLNGTAPCTDVSASVQVIVNPVPDAGNNGVLAICSNQNSVDLFTSLTGSPQTGGTWSPPLASGTGVFNPAVDLSGIYTYTVTGISPCVDDTATVTVTVTQGPEAGTNNTITLCVNSTPQDLALLLGPNSQPGGTWSPTLASGTGVFDPAVDTAGDYTYTLSGTQPCDNDSAVITVTVNPIPNAGDNATVTLCENNPSQDLFPLLGTNAQLGGIWTPSLMSGTGVLNPAVDPAGTYTYTVGGGLCSSDSATVLVNISQEPNYGGVGQVLNVCISATSIDLTTGLDGTQQAGTWADDDNTGALSGSIFNPSIVGVGTYHFTYTVIGDFPCANATSTVTVIVNPLPVAGMSNTLSLCATDSSQDLFALLGSTAQTGGTWFPTLASGTGVFNPAVDNQGIYSYTVSSSYCASVTASVNVTVFQPVSSGGIGQTLNSCVNETSLDLTTGLDGTQGIGTWSDDNLTGALTGNIFNPSVIGVGTYTFTYTVNGNAPCPNASSTVTVIVHPLSIAGSDNILTVCSTDGPQDLFTLLGSTAQTGGIWSPALASGTGVFNPAIDSQGVYTYTVSSLFCSSVSASINVTVNPAANSGGAGQTLTTCTNITSLDLTTGLDGTQGVGTWNDNSSTGALSGNLFNPSLVGAGTYTFSYTVTGTAPCSDAVSTVTVVVNTAPNAGAFTGVVTLCPSVGVLDLTSLLNGADVGGVWTDAASQTVTSTITIISFAPGTYSYTYSVTNSCSTDTETVQFTILPNPQIASFNISTSPACLGSDVVVNLNGMVDGTYTLTYDLIGANTASGQTATVTITGGVGSFTIPASLLPNIGTTVANFATILNTATNCSITLIGVATQILVRPLADIDATNLSSPAVCYGADLAVTISGATNLPDGVYQFNYSIPGANPTSNNSGNVTITAGAGQFTVPATIFGSAGNYTMTIFGIIAATGCTNTTESASVSLVINALPSLQNATVTVQDTCANFASLVTISGANNLADGNYTLTYQLSGANTATTSLTIAISSGTGTFSIPASELANNGTTTLTINQLDSVTTTCGVTGTIIAPIDFNVAQLGTPQIIQDGNLFCEDDNPTIANLSGNLVGFPTVIWYNAATGGTAYNATDLLVHGTTYYAALTTASGCEGAVRLEVTVDLTVCDDILIPDGYSPNNDGINDTFEIENLAIVYPNFKLEVYNRYGNLIYTGNRNTPNWDGTTTVSGLNLGNNILPNGVYFYILYFNDGVRKPVQGRVYLNR
ncbi:MAG: gliding motility-associated C-terminal domain-containing protein, partial [Flavobacterium sp.]|uniref:T9SS type B sorting domain-containing protein n=1 Tax=Flavobacterium sp. TaxID=239 RepID=UPI0039195301